MTEWNKELQMLSFSIILHAGNARSSAMEAIKLAKNDRFQEARHKIIEAEDEFVQAHQEQTKLIQEEVKGNYSPMSMILIHAQDHLMNAMTVKDLAIEMIDMYEKMGRMK